MESILPAAMLPYWPTIRGVIIGIAIFIVGWIVSRVVARLILQIMRKKEVDLALSRFLSQIAFYALLVATVIAALGSVGVQTTSLVAVFASAGLAIGLALQGTLAHFASGVMILFFRPIRLGDFVQAGGQTGTVDDIGLFATSLITPNNEKVIVPNGKITGDSITNFTVLGRRRGAVDVGIAYGADLKKVQEVLMASAQRTELALQDPAPGVAFGGFGASSLDFKVVAWAEGPNFLPMLHNLRSCIYDDLNAAGIEIPYNQIVVHYAPGEVPPPR